MKKLVLFVVTAAILTVVGIGCSSATTSSKSSAPATPSKPS